MSKGKRWTDFINSDWNRKLVENSKNTNRIIDYDNILEFFEIKKALGKNKGKYWLFLSLNVSGLKLTDLEYTDEWSKKRINNKAIEQFRILIDKKQAKKLQEILTKLNKEGKELVSIPPKPKDLGILAKFI